MHSSSAVLSTGGMRSRRRLRLVNVRMRAPVTAPHSSVSSNRIRTGRRRSVGNDHHCEYWGDFFGHDACHVGRREPAESFKLLLVLLHLRLGFEQVLEEAEATPQARRLPGPQVFSVVGLGLG